MILQTIGCQNFGPFKDWNEIEIPQQGVISIIGEWKGQKSRSNWSGKSSFIEMITYLLYGKHRNKSDKDLIHNNASEDMIVKGTFLLEDGSQISITRGKSLSGDLILEVEGYEGEHKKDVQEYLNELTGLEYEDFINTSFFLQGDIHGIATSTSSKLKEKFSRWINNSHWDDYLETTKEFIKGLEKVINEVNYEINIIQKKKDNLDELKSSLKDLREEKELLSFDLEGLTGVESQLKAELKKIKDMGDDDYLQTEYNHILNIIEDLKQDNKELSEKKEEIEERYQTGLNTQKKIKKMKSELKEYDKISSWYEELKTRLEKYQEKYLTAKNSITRINKEIRKIADSNGVCPYKNEKCKYISIDDMLNELNKEIKEYYGIEDKMIEKLDDVKRELSETEKHLNNLRYIKGQLKTIENISITTLSDKEKQIKNCSIKIKKNISLIKDHKSKLEEIEEKLSLLEDDKQEEIENKFKENQKDIKKLRQKINSLTEEIGSLKNQISNIKEESKKIPDLEESLQELKEELQQYQFLQFAFGKDGIKSFQFESAFEEIEIQVNKILDKLETDMSLEFSSVKELNDWEKNCPVCGCLFESRQKQCPECSCERGKRKKDELSMRFYNGESEMEFTQASGGLKVILSLAIRLAISNLKRNKSGSKVDFVILDEIFSNLDSINQELVLKLIKKVMLKNLGIKQIFIISHRSEISTSFENIIKIKKYDSYSTFGWS